MTSESSGRITRATAKKNLEEKAAKAELLEESNENLRLELEHVQRQASTTRGTLERANDKLYTELQEAQAHTEQVQKELSNTTRKAQFAIHTIRNRIHSFAS